jgi:hypothetical protein
MLAEDVEGERAFRLRNIITQIKVINPYCDNCFEHHFDFDNPQLENDSRGIKLIGYPLKQNVYYTCKRVNCGYQNPIWKLLKQRK